MKKIALFLAIVLCLSAMTGFVALADETIPVSFEVLKEQPERTTGKDCYEVTSNGSFEIMQTETMPYGWGWTSPLSAKNTYYGTEVVSQSTDAHTGEYAVHVHPTENANYCDTLGGGTIIPGQVYEFSIWMKRLTESGNASVQLIFTGKKEGVEQSYARGSMSMNDIKVSDGWTKKCIRFTAPDYSNYVTVSLRFSGAGSEVLWDDGHLLCITDEMPTPDMAAEKPAIKTLDVPNADFEQGTPGTKEVPGWELTGPAVLTDKYAHSGNYALDLTNTGGSQDSEAIITLTGFEKGATYQVSAWVLTPGEASCDMGFWMSYSAKDFYDWNDVTSQLGQEKPRWSMRKNLSWMKYVAEFTPPDDCQSILLDLRHRQSPGEVYLDDLEVYMVKAPYALKPETDEVFYYTEWEKGVFTGAPYVMEDPVNSKAEVSMLTPDGKEIHKESFSDLTNGVRYEFRTEWMENKGEKYFIRLKVYDPKGTEIQSQDLPVYRFDHPTYLGSDGVFRKDGKEVTFTFGPGVTMPVLAQNPEKGGMTVVQLIGDDSGLSLREKMDKAYEQGLYVIVNLYSGSMAAGHPDQIASTKRTVENLKDHPALFAWKVQDEPYQKRVPDEQMELAYASIRNIDPHHPVYIADSVPGGFSWLFRYCDILDIDSYAGSDPDAGRMITDVFDIAMEASKGRKPFSLVEQFFTNLGYRPTVDEMRHLAYQAFLSGGSGLTFHTLGVEGSDPDTSAQITRPIWTELVENWAKWERDFMYGCFVTGEYKFVNYQKTNDILWATFTDGTDIYAICLNRAKSSSNSVVIPLSDGMNTFSVAGYSARAMTGEAKRITGEGTLSLDLAPMEAVVWKVTPYNTLGTSHLKVSKYRDLLSYPWAYNAVATLEAKGIVNSVSDNWYGPGKKITRGDYAMFLVRTLGLTGGTGENFADVKPDAEYAKELAIGKAAGIINGIGDNKFNPEAEITRQDMMTMTSRALALTGSADLSAFSDAGAIADYAAPHVAAMVADGLIKGNADGTINPLGNTTRAEAAVIMQRLSSK